MVKSLLRFVLIVLGLALCTGTAAHALAFGPCPGCPHTPEIDPGLAVSALTLLAGSLAVLSIRRKK